MGIHIYEGAKLEINGVHKFSAISCDYAITSEEVFLITNRGTELENWEHLNVIFCGVAFNAEPVLLAIKGAVKELLSIWRDLFQMRVNGDGNCEYSYLNQGGLVEIFEKRDGNLYTYTLHGLKVRGNLTFTPPDGLHTKGEKIIYSINTEK